MAQLPQSVVARLSDYRRHLDPQREVGRERIFSHELADLVGVTAAQVRRDLMTVGFTGSPARGYEIAALIDLVDELLGPTGRESMTLVGVGHLGRALLAYCSTRKPAVQITTAFDVDPEVIGQDLGCCTVDTVDRLEPALESEPALVGILAVPADEAQDMADRLVASGVMGLINFTSVRIRVPEGMPVEHIDLATSAEKVLFYARQRAEELTAGETSAANGTAEPAG